MPYTNFTIQTDSDGVAFVTWDMPGRSMNVFTVEVMDELDAVVDAIVADEKIKGAIIASGKAGSFSGGADLKMIRALSERFEATKGDDRPSAIAELFQQCGQMSRLYRKIETCGKPFVAAINGTCLGGAFELALACHARVAGTSAKLGLPEVKVGIFPGAGGTQRVARMVETQAALQMLLTGETLPAEKAAAMGLIDAVVPDAELLDRTKAVLRDGVSPVKPWDRDGFRLPSGPVHSQKGAQIWPAATARYRKETADNLPGARAILKCVYEGLLLPMDQALRVEQRYFASVLQTTVVAMMIRTLFLSMQEINKGARRPRVASRPVRSLGVLGADPTGIGLAAAKAGIDVVVIGHGPAAAGRDEAGNAGPKAIAGSVERIRWTTDYRALADVDLVIEAVGGNETAKAEAMRRAAAVMRSDAVFASTASTITEPAAAFPDRKRLLGLNVFPPAAKTMLAEIARGPETGDEALATVFDFSKTIRKTPIVVNGVTGGFFTNRCVRRYLIEACDMLIEGIAPTIIENAARSAGFSVGPVTLGNEIGIDHAERVMRDADGDSGQPGAVDPRHLERIDATFERHAPGNYDTGAGLPDVPATEFADLKQRLLVTMALEAARTMEAGIVADPREADIGSILGFGYPAHTGGVLSFIDGMGTRNFVAICKALAEKHGSHFAPTALLLEMASRNETVYGRFGGAPETARIA